MFVSLNSNITCRYIHQCMHKEININILCIPGYTTCHVSIYHYLQNNPQHTHIHTCACTHKRTSTRMHARTHTHSNRDKDTTIDTARQTHIPKCCKFIQRGNDDRRELPYGDSDIHVANGNCLVTLWWWLPLDDDAFSAVPSDDVEASTLASPDASESSAAGFSSLLPCDLYV